MPHKPETFTLNLKEACSTRRSVSDICRRIGINRQQFNRYINGQVLPSPHNLLRIAGHFGLAAEDFLLPAESFRLRLSGAAAPAVRGDMLQGAFPGDLPALRRYLGLYQTYHRSLSWPGRIVCSCTRLHEEGGMVLVKSIERIVDRENEIRQLSKYEGQAAYRRNRIFIVERSLGAEAMIAQTILLPFEVHQRVYLKGVTTGVSWRKDNLPYASRMIWRFLGPKASARAVLARCGVFEEDAQELPATVRGFLDAREPQMVGAAESLVP
ncbi:helix-turn-helix domain-containing protein [Aureimonas populi]|uniref:Helix-turn-helix domain-containing protein n=1 Tax=Aureimonas populi TaxID=1701758 RepID=A0ABW5CGL3_9HYPH|nr:helix-turn-helix transcriptional regulator [Aureimonas populi]